MRGLRSGVPADAGRRMAALRARRRLISHGVAPLTIRATRSAFSPARIIIGRAAVLAPITVAVIAVAVARDDVACGLADGEAALRLVVEHDDELGAVVLLAVRRLVGDDERGARRGRRRGR